MKYYKLRVDTVDPEVLVHITRHYSPDCYLVAVEGLDGENPHSHYYLEMEENTATNLRAYIRRTVGTGNRVYSCSEADSEKPVEYLAYCIKCADYQSHNIDLTAAKSHDYKIKDDRVRIKKERKSVLQSIIEHYKYDETGIMDASTCIDQVILYHREKGVLIREFFLVSLVQTLLLKYLPEYSVTLAFNIHRAIDKSRC